MRRLRFLLTGLVNWIRGSTLDRQMHDEFAFHLESRTRDLMREGLSARAAGVWQRRVLLIFRLTSLR